MAGVYQGRGVRCGSVREGGLGVEVSGGCTVTWKLSVHSHGNGEPMESSTLEGLKSVFVKVCDRSLRLSHLHIFI